MLGRQASSNKHTNKHNFLYLDFWGFFAILGFFDFDLNFDFSGFFVSGPVPDLLLICSSPASGFPPCMRCGGSGVGWGGWGAVRREWGGVAWRERERSGGVLPG